MLWEAVSVQLNMWKWFCEMIKTTNSDVTSDLRAKHEFCATNTTQYNIILKILHSLETYDSRIHRFHLCSRHGDRTFCYQRCTRLFDRGTHLTGILVGVVVGVLGSSVHRNRLDNRNDGYILGSLQHMNHQRIGTHRHDKLDNNRMTCVRAM